MTLFWLKLIGAPLFLAAATLAARRWGETAGGLIAALPLVSGPISVFLAIENGAAFAVKAALGSLAGTAALAFFGLAYAVLCPKSRVLALLLGSIAFAAASAAIGAMHLTLVPLFVLCVACLAAGSRLIPIEKDDGVKPAPVKHDIALRMALMAVMILAVTAVAPLAGPAVSGVLSALPLMAVTMALFAQRGGRHAGEAQKVMKGLVSGLTSAAVFYLVLSLVLEDGALIAGYAAAIAATLLAQGAILFVMRRRRLL